MGNGITGACPKHAINMNGITITGACPKTCINMGNGITVHAQKHALTWGMVLTGAAQNMH